MTSVDEYFEQISSELQPLAARIRSMFDKTLPHCKTKVWHSIPVWFDEGNPIVTVFENKGKLKVMFWNGKNFDQSGLKPVGKYSAGDITYVSEADFDEKQLAEWITEGKNKPQTDLAMRVKVG